MKVLQLSIGVNPFAVTPVRSILNIIYTNIQGLKFGKSNFA